MKVPPSNPRLKSNLKERLRTTVCGARQRSNARGIQGTSDSPRQFEAISVDAFASNTLDSTARECRGLLLTKSSAD